MRSVRCDACGRKALVAASQCPHCGHLFELRDSFGELLPMAHCPTCDSDYPERLGECKWCGTKPEGVRIAPYAWKGAGVLVFVGLAWGAWLARRTTPSEHAVIVKPPSASTQVAQPETTMAPLVASGLVDTAVPLSNDRDSAGDVTSTGVAFDEGRSDSLVSQPVLPPPATEVEPVDLPPRASRRERLPEPRREPVRVPEREVVREPVREPLREATRAPVRSKATAPARRKARWVAAVAHHWVVVRVAANNKARIVASIGPDTRVQLGEARGGWVRVRTRGLSGWVEGQHFSGYLARAR